MYLKCVQNYLLTIKFDKVSVKQLCSVISQPEINKVHLRMLIKTKIIKNHFRFVAMVNAHRSRYGQ